MFNDILLLENMNAGSLCCAHSVFECTFGFLVPCIVKLLCKVHLRVATQLLAGIALKFVLISHQDETCNLATLATCLFQLN